MFAGLGNFDQGQKSLSVKQGENGFRSYKIYSVNGDENLLSMAPNFDEAGNQRYVEIKLINLFCVDLKMETLRGHIGMYQNDDNRMKHLPLRP